MNTGVFQKTQDFNSRIKVEGITKNIEYERRMFLDYLANNPQKLEHFSTQQLKTILKYSEEENERRQKLLKNK